MQFDSHHLKDSQIQICAKSEIMKPIILTAMTYGAATRTLFKPVDMTSEEKKLCYPKRIHKLTKNGEG